MPATPLVPRPSSFAIRERHTHGITVLELEGNLRLGVEEQLGSHVRRLLKAGRKQLVLRLDKVERLDSTGVGALISAVRAARDAGGDARLCQLSRPVADVLRFMRLTRRPDLLCVFPDEEAALASFRAGAPAGPAHAPLSQAASWQLT